MEPGRELDKLITEKVMGGADGGGFCCPSCEGSHFGAWEGKRTCHDEFGLACRWEGPASEAPPPYSTEIAAAWEVVGRMTELAIARKLWGPSLTISVPLGPSSHWMVRLSNDIHGGMAEPHTDETIWSAIAEDAPHAICLAALKAVGVEV